MEPIYFNWQNLMKMVSQNPILYNFDINKALNVDLIRARRCFSRKEVRASN